MRPRTLFIALLVALAWVSGPGAALRASAGSAGFSSEQILEVIAVVAASTMTNYTGSVTQPALEAPFEEFAWHAPRTLSPLYSSALIRETQ